MHLISILSLISLFFVSLSSPVLAWEFTVHTDNANPSNWNGLDEKQVFYRRLEHSETNKSWTIKIGKGGQLFSIKTPETGELIAPQRADAGQWVDEILQHTLPFPPEKPPTPPDNNIVDGDIHQAGYYSQSELGARTPLFIPQSVYSPLFHFYVHPDSKSVSYKTWPQHAHLPRTIAKNQVLFSQTITDLGGGLVEINLEINNWGEETYPLSQLPWSAYNANKLTSHIISLPDGSYEDRYSTFGGYDIANEIGIINLRNNSTGGWIAFTTGTNPSDRGIGIIYGKTLQPQEGNKTAIRWGQYSTDPLRTGVVGTIRRNIELLPKESLHVRYFIAIGSLSDIQNLGNSYQNQVILEKISRSEQDANRIAICSSPTTEIKRGCPAGTTPLFHTLRYYVPSAKPLFLLKNTLNSKYRVTDDPYEISFNPTDNKTQYVDFLGWAMPEEKVSSSLSYQLLDTLLQPNLYVSDTPSKQSLMVIKSSPSSLPGDANGDNRVDGVDYVVWLTHYNQSVTGTTKGDFNNSGKVDGVDYVVWATHYSSN